MSNVFANGRKIAHQGDGVQQVCPVPDVCKTPSPGGPVPVPYVNVALNSDLADGSKDVDIEGSSVALSDSNLKISSGDEAGSAGGGITSSKIKGKLTWGDSSPDVLFDGKGVIRFMDVTQHNGNSSNTFTINPGDMIVYPGLEEEENCPNCGQPMSAHEGLPRLPESEESRKAAADFGTNLLNNPTTDNRGMIGALVTNCQPPNDIIVAVAGKSFKGWQDIAGAAAGDLLQPAPEAMVRNIRGPNPVKVTKIAEHSPNNCAAQRMIQTALRKGCTPVAMTEAWMVKKPGASDSSHSRQSCPTCKDNIARMLCPNPTQKS